MQSFLTGINAYLTRTKNADKINVQSHYRFILEPLFDADIILLSRVSAKIDEENK